jgi:hypothetical protein
VEESLPHVVERKRVSGELLLRSLPPDGDAGWSAYARPGAQLTLPRGILSNDGHARAIEIITASETGAVILSHAAQTTLVIPPFPVEETCALDEVHTAPLRDLLERKRVVAAFLLRLGGYTIGVFRDDFIVASKTDRRFVKNRHRKGGQSQRRFERTREKQVHELFGAACDDAKATLDPYRDELEHVVLGGDRRTLLAFRKECSYFETFGDRLMARTLHVPGDPRRASLDALPREIWSSDVHHFDTDATVERP